MLYSDYRNEHRMMVVVVSSRLTRYNLRGLTKISTIFLRRQQSSKA